MLDADAPVLENAQQLAGEPDLFVHHVLLDAEHGKILLAGHAGDVVLGDGGQLGNDHGSGIVRTVGVADVDRYSDLPHRGDGLVVENTGAHIGQLPDFAVAHLVQGVRVLHYARIGHEQPGNVGPVLVQFRHHRAGHDGDGNLAAAAGEGLYADLRVSAVKARHHEDLLFVRHAGAQRLIGPGIDATGRVEKDRVLGIDELGPQKRGHEQAA